MGNKTLGLDYYADMKDSPLSDLFRQANIKTDTQLLAFYYYSCQYFLDTGRSTGAYIIFYQGVPNDCGTHITVPVAQSSSESYYNSAYTAGMALAQSGILIHGFFNKDTYIVTQEAPLSIFDGKYAVCMAKNSKYTKHTRHVSRRVNFVRNGEK